MGKWILEIDNESPPVRWQCARCEAPVGSPHAEGCNCTLVEGVEIEDAAASGFGVAESSAAERKQ